MEHETRPALLASDAERERAAMQLRDAVVEGRLTLEEFSDRVGRAQVARTDTDLTELVADLPVQSRSVALAPEGLRHRAAFSRLVRRGFWELPERASFRCYFGTIVLDLRQAILHGDVVEIDVFNLFGTVTLIAPHGIRVSVDGGGLFASQVIEPPGAAPVPGSPELRIRVSGPGGTIHVRSHD